MRFNSRRAVSDVIGVLIMLAVVVSVGALSFIISTTGLNKLSQNYGAAMTASANAVKESFAVEQVSFLLPNLQVDGTGTTQVAGSSSSISTPLTTTGSSDVLIVYVSPADVASNSPPAVSSITGGGLTWTHRATTSTQSFPTNSYVPITLTNSQTAATPSTFQQKVTWDPATYAIYESADLGNIRFCTDANCVTQLFAWVESCTSSCTTSATSASAWVRLTSSIPANGGQLTIYMVFYPASTDFDANYWGEAPQLSSTYGQFDNGADVFNFYDDFAGTSLSSNWTVVSGGSGAVTVNNGVTIATSGKGTNYAYIASATQTQPQVAEAYMVSQSGGIGPLLGESTSNSINNYDALYSGYSLDWSSGKNAVDDLVAQKSTGGTSIATPSEGGFPAGIWGVTWAAAGTEYFTDGTISSSQTDNSLGSIANYNIYLGQNSGPASSFVADYARTRAVPPSNVMPTATLGAVGTATATLDLEEWYAITASPLSAVTITANLASADSEATWIAVFGVSGANTASPFDSNPGLPATAGGTNAVQTTISTSSSSDALLYACAAGAGSMASGFTSMYSNSYPSYQDELVGYQLVSTTESSLVESCGTSSTNGAEISDALVASGGADLYIRNVGSVSTTIQGVYITDATTGSFVAQFQVSMAVNVGTFGEISHSTVFFYPADGDTYSFVVTSSLGNSIDYSAEVT